MFFDSSKLASWIAILSLMFSSALTSTHNHGDCGCSEGHDHSTAVIAGLENLPAGDCDCETCDSPAPQHHDHKDHDEDTCSICRMVFEHGDQAIEFEFTASDETLCEFVPFIVDAPYLGVVSEYLTRGPPALTA